MEDEEGVEVTDDDLADPDTELTETDLVKKIDPVDPTLSLDDQYQILSSQKREIDGELESLQKEKNRLENEMKKSVPRSERVNLEKKRIALNKEISDFQTKQIAFDNEVDAYNARIEPGVEPEVEQGAEEDQNNTGEEKTSD